MEKCSLADQVEGVEVKHSPRRIGSVDPGLLESRHDYFEMAVAALECKIHHFWLRGQDLYLLHHPLAEVSSLCERSVRERQEQRGYRP